MHAAVAMHAENRATASCRAVHGLLARGWTSGHVNSTISRVRVLAKCGAARLKLSNGGIAAIF